MGTRKTKSSIKSLKDISITNMLKDSGKPIGIMAGVLAGIPISMIIDKQMTGRRVLGMEGDKIKEWVKPCAKFVLGMTAYRATDNTIGQYIGIGLAANAGLTFLENILGGKDLLQGASDENYLYDNVALESATPLELPVLDVEPSNYETSEIIDRIVDENPGEREIEGLENVEGVGDIDLGRNEEQIAGEAEELEEDSDMDIDDIP